MGQMSRNQKNKARVKREANQLRRLNQMLQGQLQNNTILLLMALAQQPGQKLIIRKDTSKSVFAHLNKLRFETQAPAAENAADDYMVVRLVEMPQAPEAPSPVTRTEKGYTITKLPEDPTSGDSQTEDESPSDDRGMTMRGETSTTPVAEDGSSGTPETSGSEGAD